MPFINPDKTLVVDKQYLIDMGIVERLNKLPKHPLGDNLGTRALAEWGEDESYTLALEISFYERENLGSRKEMNVRLPNSFARQALQGGGEIPDTGDITLATEETNSRADTKVQLMLTYIKAWSHYPGKPKVKDIKDSLTPLTAMVLLTVITDISKGQALTPDSPLLPNSNGSSQALPATES